MRLSLKIFSVGAIALFYAFPASANWIFSKEENAFDDKKSTYIALTTSRGSYALGARCLGGELSIVIITPEKIDLQTVKLMNITNVKIMIRVDKNDIIEIPAEANEVDDKLAVHSTDKEKTKSSLEQMIKAKDRISAAIKVLDNNFHNNNFSIRNSSKSIKQVLDGCNS